MAAVAEHKASPPRKREVAPTSSNATSAVDHDMAAVAEHKASPPRKRKVAPTEGASKRIKKRKVTPCVDVSADIGDHPAQELDFQGHRVAVMGTKGMPSSPLPSGDGKTNVLFVAADVLKAITASKTSRKYLSSRFARYESPRDKVKLAVRRANTLGVMQPKPGTNCLTLAGLHRLLAEESGGKRADTAAAFALCCAKRVPGWRCPPGTPLESG
jgi:hypothetical protein